MVVYLDTSSLVKLYVEEEDSPKIADLVRSSKVTATSLIAYTEARAAFSRRFRENAFTPGEYKHLISVFDKDWENYLIVRVTKELVRLAGNLAEEHGFSGKTWFKSFRCHPSIFGHNPACGNISSPYLFMF
jgi:uncharacterized protein with PIN domain